jgi:glutamate-1-semialdehyde 2,1-aminomutase
MKAIIFIDGDETLFDVLFTHDSCIDYLSPKHHQPALAALYHQTLREQGILKSPSKLYPSMAVSEEDLHKTEAAVNRAVDAISHICS